MRLSTENRPNICPTAKGNLVNSRLIDDDEDDDELIL